MDHRLGMRMGALLAVCICVATCDSQAPEDESQQPPGSIGDLQVLPPTGVTNLSNLLLRWTVPLDPETQGPPVSYEICYDPEPLAASQWQTSTWQMLVSETGLPGQMDSTIVAGLDTGRLYYFVIRSIGAARTWSGWSNVASLATLNTPPMASFTVECHGTRVDVDAGASRDNEDPSTLLVYRWDWESDGLWDTPWGHEVHASHRYAAAGERVVRLQVRDRGGAIAEDAHRPGNATLESTFRGIWSLDQVCCSPGNHGICNEWCAFESYVWQSQEPGASTYEGFSSFVSADSIYFRSLNAPGLYGIQGIAGVVSFDVCGTKLLRVALEGSPYLKITGPGGDVFPPATPDPPSFPFVTTISNGPYLVHSIIRQPATVTVSVTSAPASL